MNKPIVCRYQVTSEGEWHLNAYSRALADRHGVDPGSEPEWLKPILVLAAAADAFVHPLYPPPYRILWFQVDQSLNFLRFGND